MNKKPKKGKAVKRPAGRAGVKIQKTKNDSKNLHWLGLVLILIITILVYSKVTKLDFVANWDDNLYVINNPHIHSLNSEGIKDISKAYVAGNYHPLTLLSLALEMKFFKLNAKGYHLDNLILHLLNVLLVFILFKKLSSKKVIPLVIAFLFALHPFHVESVAWIAERKDVLYAFFYLLSLIFYINYLDGKNEKLNYILTFLMFVLSCLTKSMAVTLPVVLILFDIWKGRKFSWKWIDKLPFFILSILFGIVAIKAQASSGAIYESLPFSWFQRLFLVSYGIVFYLYKLILPLNLCVTHFYPGKEGLSVIQYLSPLILLGLAVAVYFLKKHRKVLVFGFLFFLITVSVVIQLIPVGFYIVAERYSYIPYLGLFFIIAYFIQLIIDKKSKFKNEVIVVFVIFGLFYIYQTYNRIDVWQNGITLFTDAVEKNPDKSIVYQTRGNEYLRIGNNHKAIQDFSEAVKLLPTYGDAFHNLGVAKYNLKDYAGAIQAYDHAISLQPKNPNVYYSRGLAKFETTDIKGALEDFNKVEKLAGNYMDVYNYLGASKGKLDDLDGAIAEFDLAIKSDPKNANAWFNRGNVWFLKFQQYHSKEFLNKAVSDYQKAAGLGHASAKEMLGKIVQ